MQAVCLVVPCYNEQHRLDAAAFERFLQAHPHVAICFADDRSDDGTLAVLRRIHAGQPDRTMVLDLPSHSGKGGAVRRAMLKAHDWMPFNYIGYWDADLATPLEVSDTMWRLAQARPGCLLVMGSRVRRLGAAIDRQPFRHYLGRVFATVASLILKLPAYDTQCGAKLIRADLVPEIFREPFTSRWFFDVEVLARLRNRVGLGRLMGGSVEFPLERWRDVHGSKMEIADMARAPLDLWRIHRRYNDR